MNHSLKKRVAAFGVSLAAAGAVSPVFAEDQKPAGAAPAKEQSAAAPKAQDTEALKAVRNISLAQSLVDYGIANKSPSALITAAEILHANQVQDDPARFVKAEGVEKAKGDGKRTPESVLAAAKEMIAAEGVKGLDQALAAAEEKVAERTRGGHPHAIDREGHIHGGEVDKMWFHFHGHNHVDIHPEGFAHNVDLDLQVFNRFGQLVASDTSPAPGASVHWDGDGDFVIVITLHGSHADYHLTSN